MAQRNIVSVSYLIKKCAYICLRDKKNLINENLLLNQKKKNIYLRTNLMNKITTMVAKVVLNLTGHRPFGVW